MRSIREVLRLKAEGFTDRAVAQSVGYARSTMQECADSGEAGPGGRGQGSVEWSCSGCPSALEAANAMAASSASASASASGGGSSAGGGDAGGGGNSANSGAPGGSDGELQGDSGAADVLVSADRYHPSDGLFPTTVILPGVSSWTNIGNLANGALYLALLHANPNVAGRLQPERRVPGGGAVDQLLDNSLSYELKPYSREYGPSYSSALDQLNGYNSAGVFTAGTWADLGIATQTIGVSGTFSGYGLTLNGTFVFGYDLQSRSSGLLFYMFSGSYSFQRGDPGGAAI